MAQAVEPEPRAPSVTFEVERFEAEGHDRLVLSGRWFGLPGRRFVRPALTLGADGNRQRVLADLEHKPWAARDGQLWEATFPYERAGEDLGTVELTVASDIAVTLPAPGSGASRVPPAPRASEQRIRARPRRDDFLDNLRGVRRDGRPRPGSGNAADPNRAGRSTTAWEDGSEAWREASRAPQTPPPVGADGPDAVGQRRSDTAGASGRSAAARRSNGGAARQPDGSPDLTRRLSQAQQEIEMLKTELARYQGARVEAVSAMTRQDAAISRLTDAIAARDQAVEAHARAVRARDQAYRERDRMAGERDQARRERDRAIAKAKKVSEAAATHRNHTPGAMATQSRAITPEGVVWAQRILAISVLVIAVLAFAITARLV